MKLQDLLLKAMAKKISWMEAAEIAGVTDRTMRRIRDRYREFGYSGQLDGLDVFFQRAQLFEWRAIPVGRIAALDAATRTFDQYGKSARTMKVQTPLWGSPRIGITYPLQAHLALDNSNRYIHLPCLRVIEERPQRSTPRRIRFC